MSSYIENNLSQNESLLIVGKISFWFYVPVVGFWVLFSLISIGFCLYFNSKSGVDFSVLSLLLISLVSLIIAFYNYLRFRCVEMAVTNKRLVYKYGIIAENVQELRLDKVESVTVEKSILGKILGYGDIIFTGTGDTSLVFKKISDPNGIKNEIDKAFDKRKLGMDEITSK